MKALTAPKLCALELSNYDGYIFDADGTLFDSMPVHRISSEQCYTEFTGVEFTQEMRDARKTVINQPQREIIHFMNRRFGWNIDPDKFIPRKEEIYLSNVHLIKPFEPVLALIEQGSSMQKPLAVASNGIGSTCRATLDHFKVTNYFTTVVAVEDAPAKPKPDMLLLCAERMGINPRRCLMIGDAPADFDAAKAAGMDWIDVIPHVQSRNGSSRSEPVLLTTAGIELSPRIPVLAKRSGI